MSDLRIKELLILVMVLSLVLSIKLIDRFNDGDIKFFSFKQDEISQQYETVDIKDSEDLANFDSGSEFDNANDNYSHKNKDKSKYIMVHIKGAVNNAGVYEVKKKSRICDAIEIAGGFSDDAQVDALNLADFVYDAQQIIVPKIGEEVINNVDYENKKWTISDLNRASAKELENIDGIGPSTAKKIVEYREAHGSFSKLSDLAKVSGIGYKSIEGWKEVFIQP